MYKLLMHSLLLFALLIINTITYAQNYSSPVQLSAAIADSSVGTPNITSDGNTLVYAQYDHLSDTSSLLSVPTSGGAVKELSNITGVSLSVTGHQLLNDDSRAIFTAITGNPETVQIFSVPINGGTPVQLSTGGVSGQDVRSFRLSNDSTMVVYLAENVSTGIVELFSVPVLGTSAPLRLHRALTTSESVPNFRITPNSERVLFRADLNSDNNFELFSTPIQSVNVIQLSTSLVDGGDVTSFQISPDSSVVVYRADQEFNNRFEIYKTSPLGGNPEKVNGPIIDENDVASFSFTADGNYLVFRARQTGDNEVQLYWTDLTLAMLPAPQRVILSNEPAGRVTEFKLSESGNTIAFINQDAIADNSLHTYQIGDMNATKVVNSNVFDVILDYEISANGSHIVAQVQEAQNLQDNRTLHSFRTDGTLIVNLTPNTAFNNNVLDDFKISANGELVFFRGDITTNTVNELFATQIESGDYITLNDPLPNISGTVYSFVISPVNDDVFYVSNQINSSQEEIFRVTRTDNNVAADELCFPIKTQSNTFVSICL